MESSDEEDFSYIRPSLTKLLKNILDKYPDNGQIIKEILQNAEDAGATTVKFLYDETSNNTIFDLGKQELRGPALYVYNDAMFTKDDWQGIRMLEQSIKEKDPLKIGRFGLGYKSVFHLTDHPSILSGSIFAVNSPDDRTFGKGKDGVRKDFGKSPPTSHGDHSRMYADILNTDVKRGYCDGTLFKFPLRRTPSPVSDTIYDRERIINLFQMFFREGQLSLVFLQHLENIEFHVRSKETSNFDLLRKFSIHEDDLEDVRRERQRFVSQMKSCFEGSSSMITFTQSMFFSIVDFSTWQSELKIYVCNVHAGSELENISRQHQKSKSSRLEGAAPIVGVAFPVCQEKRKGHVFCALPLPMQSKSLTGLPVHVNGSFALGSERNDLKRASAVDEHVDDNKVLWNDFLTNNALPIAYEELIDFIKSHCSKEEEVYEQLYEALPKSDDVSDHWRELANSLYEKVLSSSIFWTKAMMGYVSIGSTGVRILNADENNKGERFACEALIRARVPIITIPRHIGDQLEDHPSAKFVDPGFIRNHFYKNPSIVRALNSFKKKAVLEYLIQQSADIKELKNTKLLPLENGSFCEIECNIRRKPIYISTQSHPDSLLPSITHRLLSKDISQPLLKKLNQIANHGLCQLKQLDKMTMISLIREQQSSNTSSRAWLDTFWKYVKDQEIDLSAAEDIQVIPLNYSMSGSLELIPLQKKSTVLFLNDPSFVSTDLLSLFSELRFTVINSIPRYLQQHPKIFDGYIYKCRPTDILSLFVNGYHKDNSIVDIFKRKANGRQIKELVDTFTKAVSFQSVSYDAEKTMKNLHLFKIHGTNSTYTSLSQVNKISPENVLVVPKTRQMLENSHQTGLACKFGAEVINMAQMINEFLLEDIICELSNSQKRTEAILFIMNYLQKQINNGTVHYGENNMMILRLKSAQFMEDGKRVGDLFDPYDTTVKELFPQSLLHFPANTYWCYLGALRTLGLRSASDVTENEIVSIIKEIGSANRKGRTDNVNKRRSAALIRLLSENREKLRNIRSISCKYEWIEISQKRPYSYPSTLPWKADNEMKVFESPSKIFKSGHALIIGAVNPVTNHDVAIFEQILPQPSLEDVAKQLRVIATSYKGSQKGLFIQTLEKVYTFLSSSNRSIPSSVLDFDWVWNGRGFCKPTQMITNVHGCGIDLTPHVFIIPDEIFFLKDFLEEQGAFENDDSKCYFMVLEKIKEKNGNGIDMSTLEGEKDFELVLKILEVLSARDLNENDLESVLIPTFRSDEMNIFLVSTPQCVFLNGSVANLSLENFDDISEKHLVHCKISSKMAKVFHIQTLQSEILNVEELMFKQYGQHEPLTSRLNRILEDYRDGFAIPKELLQNADDAGATEICFLYDQRQNKTAMTSLLTSKMQDFQGPALWAYNNAVFTDQDFNNLTKIHGATKKDQADKIGKFGLGFNSVYNITDLPSLVSNESIVFLDPHVNNLQEHIKNTNQPGIKLKFASKRAFSAYQDQWKPYEGLFGLTLNKNSLIKPYQGTLFRFPLRTGHQADVSEIKKLRYDEREMKELVKKVFQGARSVLLFTQNVVRFSFYHLAENASSASQMTEIFSVCKTIPRIHKPLKSGDCEKVLSVAAKLLKGGKFNMKSDVLCQYLVEMKHNLLDSIFNLTGDSIALPLEDSWLVTWIIDSNECFDLAMKGEGDGLNPSAAVAVKISNDKKLPLESDGHVFCQIPLPISSGLPVHINGSFALSNSRQAFRQTSDDDKVGNQYGSDWNDMLMKGPVANAYVASLEFLHGESSRNIDEWYDLWPLMQKSSTSHCISKLIHGFYYHLIETGAKFIPCLDGHWHGWKDIYILDDEIEKDQELMKSFVAFLKHVNATKHFVNLPKKVKGSISSVGLSSKLDEITIKRHDALTYFFEHVASTPLSSKQRNTITKYALQIDFKPCVVRCTKCIPTLPNEELKAPSKLIDRQGEASRLFCAEEGFFQSEEFQGSMVHEKLLKLGMISNDIPMSIFIERASSVRNINIESAIHRSQLIVSLLKKKLELQSDVIPNEDLGEIPFLPVLAKPKYWSPLPWAGECSAKFLAPTQMYSRTACSLVGCHAALIDDDIDTGCGPLGSKLASFLHVKSDLSTGAITMQLRLIAEKNGNLPLAMQSIFLKIYRELSRQITVDRGTLGIGKIKELVDQPVILIGKELFEPRYVSFQQTVNIYPYLLPLPEQYAEDFQNLMTDLGVKERFKVEDCLNVLQKMETEYNLNAVPNDVVKVLRTLLEHTVVVAKRKDDGRIDFPDGTVFRLPDSHGILQQADSLCIKSHSWIPEEIGMKYLHKDIPVNLALKLGAKESRTQYFDNHAIGLPFGQHERLTVRLKKILDSYVIEEQILYEMLQNADDAKATEVEFILDVRQHKTEKIFSDEWKPLQGPALLVRNNGKFRKEDLEGIQKLGEGSKSENPLATGKYGVGFNVVYHLTDAPSLLTTIEGKGCLCIFDPHIRFIRNAKSPGIKVEKAIQKLKCVYEDIYFAMLLNIYGDIPETIFRLPLRNREQAKISEISKREITVEAVKTLLKKFIEKLKESVIFLNSVKRVSISEVCVSDEKPKELYAVSVKCDDDSMVQREQLIDDLNCAMKSVTHDELLDKVFPLRPYILMISDSKCKEIWQVIQKVATPSNIPETVKQHGINKFRFLPVAGVANCLDIKSKAKEGFLPFPHHGKIYNLLPLTFAIDLPININGQFILEHESRHRLWSSVAGFQQDWNMFLLEECVVPCYVDVIKRGALDLTIRYKKGTVNELVAKTYPGGFETCNKSTDTSRPALRAVYPPELRNFFNLFPKMSSDIKDEYMKRVIIHLYQTLADDHETILPVLRPFHSETAGNLVPEWHASDPEEGLFYVPSFEDSYFTFKDIKSLLNILLKEGLNIFNIPWRIQDAFEKSERPLHKLSADVAKTFLKGKGKLELQKNLKKENMEKINLLLEFCEIRTPVELDGLPLLITSDSVLSVFNKDRPVFTNPVSSQFKSTMNITLHSSQEKILHKVIQEDVSNSPLKLFLYSDLAEALGRDMASLQTNDEKQIELGYDEKCFPKRECFEGLWKYLRREHSRIGSQRMEEFSEETEDKKWDIEKRIHQEETEAIAKSLSNWCLIPATREIDKTGKQTKKHILVPLKHAHIICERPYDYDKLKEVMEQIRLPKLEFLVAGRFLHGFIASPKNLSSFLYGLHVQASRYPSTFMGLTPDQCEVLLQQFNSAELHSILSGLNVSRLKSLPIFKALDGKCYPINQKKPIFIADVPSEGSQVWMDKFNVFAARPSGHSDVVRTKIGFETCSDVTVYKKYILPCFLSMDAQDQHKHLVYIKNFETHRSHVCNDGCPLLKMLADIPFIRVENRSMKASELFDPRNKIFKMFLPSCTAFPKIYEKEEWLDFLVKLGMIEKVSADHFLNFATEIETKDDSEKGRVRSEALVIHLFGEEELKNDDYFLSRLRGKMFLFSDPVDRAYIAVAPPAIDGGSKICFEGAGISPINLWTVSSILPSYAHFLDRLFKPLRVMKKAHSQLVEQNLINVISSGRFRSSPSGKEVPDNLCKVVEKVFISAYAHFQRDDLYVPSRLRDCESIIISINETNAISLMKPRRTTLKRSISLLPHLCSVPEDLLRFSELFKKIGTTQDPTCFQLAFILSLVANESQGRPLDVNTIRIVREIVSLLAYSIRTDSSNIEDVDVLFLPTVAFSSLCKRQEDEFLEYTMTISSDSIAVDDWSKEDRLLKFDKECVAISQEDPKIFLSFVNNLPRRLRPQLLSEVVTEEVPSYVPIASDSEILSIEQNIQSTHFKESLTRLILSEFPSRNQSEIEEEVLHALDQISIKSVECVTTVLSFESKPILGSEKDRTSFCEKESDRVILLVGKGAKFEKSNIAISIGMELARTLGAILPADKAVLLPGLINLQPQDMYSYLNMFGIVKRENHSSNSNKQPEPGDFVPLELHWSLNNEFEQYYVGEIVAYEEEDSETGESSFIYAKVINIISNESGTEENWLANRYEILISENETITVGAFRIHKFFYNQGTIETSVVIGEHSLGADREDRFASMTFEDAKAEVLSFIAKAQSLNADDKRVAIKRLYLTWHPDKHQNNIDFFTKVFQFLQQELRKLESNRYEWYREGGDFSSWGTTFETWDSETRRRRRFRKDYGSRQSWGFADTNNAQPYEAKRWLRQAEFDLNSARTYDTCENFEWKCLMCHQAAEKALKAALLLTSGNSMDHNLGRLASGLSIDGIQTDSERLERLLGSSTRLRYPDQWPYPKIPHSQYDSEDAKEALLITERMLEKLKSFVRDHDV